MPRIEQVSELIKREISKMIQFGDVSDPRVSFVTIMTVQVSKDLQHARVKFSLLSDKPEDINNATEGLNSCAGYIRKLISQRLDMRHTPEIKFYYDKGVKYAVEVDKLLEEIKQQQGQKGAANE